MILAALAAYRATKAVVSDDIGRPVREHLTLWAYSEHAGKWRSKVWDAAQCQNCLGFWLTGASLLAGRFRILRPFVLWFAAAAIQSLLVDASEAMAPEDKVRTILSSTS